MEYLPFQGERKDEENNNEYIPQEVNFAQI
jgi:hypothetical protein